MGKNQREVKTSRKPNLQSTMSIHATVPFFKCFLLNTFLLHVFVVCLHGVIYKSSVEISLLFSSSSYGFSCYFSVFHTLLLTVVHGVRWEFTLTLLHLNIEFPKNIFWKHCIFPTVGFQHLWRKSVEFENSCVLYTSDLITMSFFNASSMSVLVEIIWFWVREHAAFDFWYLKLVMEY